MASVAPPVVEDLDLVCPLTLDIFQDPVTAEDGFTYERASIQQWFQIKQPAESPMTRQPIGTTLNENGKLRQRAEQWRKVHGGAPHDLPRLHMLHSSIFTALDSVAEEIAALNLKHPTLIAVGNESAGKSTLLEALTGFPILPRSATLCTRLVIRVELRRGPTQLAKVSLWTRGTVAVPAEVPGSSECCALEKLSDVVRKKMDDAVKACATPVVLDKELRVVIRVPYCPSLNFLDLPGFVTCGLGQNQELPQLTRKLAEEVIAQEKDTAIFLLVVKATMQPDQSIGTEVLQKAGVFNRTLGVFTNGDKVTDDPEHDLVKGDLIRSLVRGESEGGIPTLAKGWVLCSNCSPSPKTLQGSLSGTKEMLRLHAMRESEKEFLGQLTNQIPETVARLGMPNVVQQAQSYFEEFLLDRWIPKIEEKMLSHFAAGAMALYCCGVPLPNSTAYEAQLAELRVIAPSVVPDFDLQLLSTQTETEFKRILGSRLRKVLQHESKDWMKMSERKDVLAQVQALWETMKAAQVRLKRPMFFLKATADLAGVKSTLEAQAEGLIALLGNLIGPATNQELLTCLTEALFQTPGKPPQTLMNTVTVLFSTGFGFASRTDEEQACLAQLDKKPDFRVKFREYLGARYEPYRKEFLAQAQALVKAELVEFAMQKVQPGTPVQCEVIFLRFEATAGLGHRILSLFLNSLVSSLEDLTERWVIPATAILEDKPTVEARLAALEMMQRATSVLTKLKVMKAGAKQAQQPQ
eukprot:RCo052815